MPNQQPRRRFAGRSALVTGAAGDIGSAVARALVEEGARVTLLDRDAHALESLGRDLGPAALAVAADVTREPEVEEAVEKAVGFGGGLHLVFNNAGTEGPVGPLEELDLAELERTLRINVVGAAAVLKHSLRHMGPGGSVVQTGSTASVSGAAHLIPYVASKHALLGMTRAASREVAGRGVRVSAICPGPVRGQMMERISGGRADAGTPTTPDPTTLDGGRRAEVGEIVSAVLFLLSEESGFVTGTGLLADGGRLA